MYEQPYLYMQMGKGIAEIPLHIITPDDKRKTEEIIKKGKVLDLGAL